LEQEKLPIAAGALIFAPEAIPFDNLTVDGLAVRSLPDRRLSS
jgi:hypothetical protein